MNTQPLKNQDESKINLNFKNLLNQKLGLDCLKLLALIPTSSIDCVFFDPQYRSILNKMNYGNEGKIKEKKRCAFVQMTDEYIQNSIALIELILKPSKYLFLWVRLG